MNRELTLSDEVVTINGHPIRKIYGGFGDGQPCILAKQVAELHERELMHINELINNNLDWLEEGTDILNLKSVIVQNDNEQLSDFLLNFYTQNALNRSEHIYLLSRQGYALLCKLLESPLARRLYKQMVRDYFVMKEKSENDSPSSHPGLTEILRNNRGVVVILGTPDGVAQVMESAEYPELTDHTSEDCFGMSVRRFRMAIEAAKLAGIADEHQARLAANRITKEATGLDLLEFVRPGYVAASESLQQPEAEEPLIRFADIWWKKYGEEAVDSHYLRRMIINSGIPLDIGRGNERSQKTRISRMLGKMRGHQVGSYHIIEAGVYRNTKLWKLKKV